MIRLLLLVMLSGAACIMPAEAIEYATARISTPVMNSPDVNSVFGGATGRDLKVDRCGQVRELEFIALPGTAFTILKKLSSGGNDVYRVATDDYPAPPSVRLYVDGRFLTLEGAAPPPRVRVLPPLDAIVAALLSAAGAPYVWGGNVPNGVPELTDWFYTGTGDENIRQRELAGLDCSGLLYHATGGWTPRNSSRLIGFGRSVPIAGKRGVDIAALLRPLDLIVWNGHVIIVLDRQTVIESRLSCGAPGNGGVVLTPLSQRIAGIMRTRRPVNDWPGGKKSRDIFVVRRWYVPEITMRDDKMNPPAKK